VFVIDVDLISKVILVAVFIVQRLEFVFIIEVLLLVIVRQCLVFIFFLAFLFCCLPSVVFFHFGLDRAEYFVQGSNLLHHVIVSLAHKWVTLTQARHRPVGLIVPSVYDSGSKLGELRVLSLRHFFLQLILDILGSFLLPLLVERIVELVKQFFAIYNIESLLLLSHLLSLRQRVLFLLLEKARLKLAGWQLWGLATCLSDPLGRSTVWSNVRRPWRRLKKIVA